VRGLRQLCSSPAGSGAYLHNSNITVAGYKKICNGFSRHNPARFSVLTKNAVVSSAKNRRRCPFATVAQAEAYAT
jgi:hypothetical protein